MADESRVHRLAVLINADNNDARGIAQIMRAGWYRTVHVKSPPCRSWRALLTARRMVHRRWLARLAQFVAASPFVVELTKEERAEPGALSAACKAIQGDLHSP